MTVEKDIVLIYFEDKPLTFARIEGILADSKKDWYHVKLLLLQVPLQVVTWILKDVYISGTEFTMNSKKMRLEKVDIPTEPLTSESPENLKTDSSHLERATTDKSAKVISLDDLKRK
ncbi:MAG: hypothetical protein KJP06_07895 [Deltaproteobacteria bacterium]|nr:hypothetical protein [Deltaproteobacteria bacterium]